MTVNHSHETGELSTIKEQVIKLLKKNPLLTAKPICKLLGLDYDYYKSYVNNIKTDWKTSLKFKLGSKAYPRPSFHNARGWVYVRGLGLSRQDAVGKGWVQSRSKNRALIWKDRLGRMEWFETDRVNIYVKAPALKGRVYQLFCNGFSMTGLITSMVILGKLLESIRLKAAHAVFEVGERLPYITIDLFKLSNGITVKLGDATHPTSVEIMFSYPDWQERNEALLSEIHRFLKGEPLKKRDIKAPEPFYVA